MAELADAPDLGSGVTDVQVQVLLSALEATNVENIAFVAFFLFVDKRIYIDQIYCFDSNGENFYIKRLTNTFFR